MILEISVRVFVAAVERVSGAVEIPDVRAALILFDDGGIGAAYHRAGFRIVQRERVGVSGGG